ncbi:MAG: PD-(D/E)XK nuclease domain-containing protein [Clostridium sp.]|nr:PD-(D/E)XK nuclease domain-containing protein [Clostridium sp.]
MLDGKKSYKLDKVRKPAANDIVLWNDFSKRTASELNMEFTTASKLKIPDGKHILSITDKDDIRYPGIVIEFKAINPRKETSLKETAESALRQIKEKDYDADRKSAYVPNYEVAKAFQMALKVGEWDEISKAISRCDELLMATIDGDAQKDNIFR